MRMIIIIYIKYQLSTLRLNIFVYFGFVLEIQRCTLLVNHSSRHFAGEYLETVRPKHPG